MSYQELEREIEERSRRWNISVDIPTGYTTAIAVPIETRHRAISKTGPRGEEVLREVLRELRGYGWPPGLVRKK